MLSIKKADYENLISNLGKLSVITNQLYNDSNTQDGITANQVSEVIADINAITCNMFYLLSVKP